MLAKEPAFELVAEALVEAVLEMKQGHLEGGDGQENLVDPVIQVGDFITLNNTDHDTNIGFTGQLPAIPVTEADVRMQIADEFRKGYDELLTLLRDGTLDLNVAFGLPSFSSAIFSWGNDTFKVQPDARALDSIAVKALQAALEGGDKVEVRWGFSGWNEFKFQGELYEAAIETK